MHAALPVQQGFGERAVEDGGKSEIRIKIVCSLFKVRSSSENLNESTDRIKRGASRGKIQITRELQARFVRFSRITLHWKKRKSGNK